MNESLNKPKGFGEILDQTFRLCKNRFSNLFMILLILVGPIYLLDAIVSFLSGTHFFRVGGGNTFYQSFMAGFNGQLNGNTGSTIPSFGVSDLITLLLGLATIVLLPVAQGAFLFSISHLQKNQEFTAKAMIKKSFSRFWPILGSSLLYGLIVFGMIFVPTIFIVILAGIVGAFAASSFPVVGIILGVVLFLAIALVATLLLTRWGLFLGAAVLEWKAPGLSRSWQLTHKRTWKTLGLFIVLFLITFVIEMAIEGVLQVFLGNSVLYTMISNLVGMFEYLILFTGYAVIFLDARTRHDADDLKEMIENY